MITDGPGPFTVTLNQTQVLPYKPDKVSYVTGATVIVADENGTTKQFLEEKAGLYQTSATYMGQVGKS